MYWRRRAVVLGGLLVVVAAVAWACSGGGGRERMAGAGETPTLTSAPAQPAPAPTVTVSVTPSPLAKATTKPPRKGGKCRTDDVVLNVTSRRQVYAKGQRPEFTLTAVHVGEGICTFDVGPRSLELRITSGDDRIWSSTDCVKSQRDLRRFPKGVPYIKTINWDRRRSTKACRGAGSSSGAGTYVAVARSGKLKTEKSVFHLK